MDKVVVIASWDGRDQSIFVGRKGGNLQKGETGEERYVLFGATCIRRKETGSR